MGTSVASRTMVLFHTGLRRIRRRTDRQFAGLLLVEWVAAIGIAVWVSPVAWQAASGPGHPRVLAAVLLGGLTACLPAALAWKAPGADFTRYVVAVGQMLTGALLIHLTGGRIETHFHVFGSLAFLAFYRDWRVLVLASAVVVIDHAVRGFWWPFSVYGTSEGGYRWLEHAAWVVFENVFLIRFCRDSLNQFRETAARQAELEAANDEVERKVQERTEALQSSQRHTRAVIDSALDCVISVDHAGRIFEFNPAAEKTFGCRRAETLGRQIGDLIAPVGPGETPRERLARLFSTGKASFLGRHIQVTALRAGGATFPAEVAVVAHRDKGSPCFTAYLRDVTDRRRAEETLRASKDAAEAADRAKTEFLAHMSHEVRTPLNGILGMTELALDSQLTEEQRDHLQTIKVSAESLLTILNDVLDLAKIEAGRLDFESVPMSLRETVAGALQLLAVPARKKGLVLTGTVAPDVPDALVGDPVRLRQVLLNLISNGVKFTEKGSVDLRVRLKGMEGEQVRLAFGVSDTGIGIPPDKQQLIFQPFRQADGSNTRKYGGTGLGLSICAKLVARMGGTVRVESQADRGSTFRFTARFGLGQRATPPGTVWSWPARPSGSTSGERVEAAEKGVDLAGRVVVN